MACGNQRVNPRAPVAVLPSAGRLFVMWSSTKGDFVVTPLRKRMLEDLQIRRYSPTTIRIYLRCIAEFAQHFGKAPDPLNGAHSPVPVVPDQREESVAAPLHPEGLRRCGSSIPLR